MGFQQYPIAGINLVRDSIQSPNFVSGQSGWTIKRDGSAEFNNVVVRGTVVADEFRSNNYVLGTSGFDLNAHTNTVEINTGFRIGGTGFGEGNGAHIEAGLIVSGTTPGFTFYTGDGTETVPGSIEVGVSGGFPLLEIDSPTTNNGHTFLQMSGSTTALLGGPFFKSTGAPVAPNVVLAGVVTVDTDMQTRLLGTSSATTGESALITGNPTGTSLRYSGSEIQAVVAGPAVGPLHLNPAGGGVDAPAMSAQYAQGGNLTTGATPFGPGTVIAGSPTITMAAPPSGMVIVAFAANVATSLAGGEFLLTLEIRQNNGAGAVLYTSPGMVMQPNGAAQQNTGERTIVATGLTGTIFLQITYQGAGTAGSVGTIRIPSIAAIPSL